MIEKRISKLMSVIIVIMMVFTMIPQLAVPVHAEEVIPDGTRPEIDYDSFAITLPDGKQKVTVGDTVNFSVNVSDDSGVSKVIMTIQNDTQPAYQKDISFSYAGEDVSRKSGKWTGKLVIDEDVCNGTWSIFYFVATDITGTFDRYISWAGEAIPSDTFEVYGTSTDPDTDGPVIDLTTFTRKLPDGKTKATVGDTITFSVNVSDESGVSGVLVAFGCEGVGASIELEYAGTDTESKNGLWTGSYTILNDDPNGIWSIYILTTDNISNSTDTLGDNLSRYDFEVYGTSYTPDPPAPTDTQPPTIDLTTLTRTLPEGVTRATVGDTITFSVNVTDDTRVDWVKADIMTRENHEFLGTIGFSYSGNDSEKQNGKWTGTFTVEDHYPVETCYLYDIVAFDSSNNSTYYYDKSLEDTEALLVDFSAYDFEIMPMELPLDLTSQNYSMMMDGIGATKTFGGNYYVNSDKDTVTPTVNVRYEKKEAWTTLASSKYTLSFAKKTGDSWKKYTGSTFGPGTYRVSAKGNESEGYSGIIAPVEFNVLVKKSIAAPTGKTLTYNGKEQTGVPAGEGYTLSGTYKATKAGTYKATATLEAGYIWNDKTTKAKEISWKIEMPLTKTVIRNTVANTVANPKYKDVIYDAVDGATGYEISYKHRNSKNWVTKSVGKTTRARISGLSINGLYEIKVRAKRTDTATNKTTFGEWSPTVYRYFYTTKQIRLKSASKGSFTMSWAKDPGATGYQVMFTTNKNGAGAANNINTVGKNATSFTKKGLKSGQTYYVQVRTLKKVGSNTYVGNISNPVPVKIK